MPKKPLYDKKTSARNPRARGGFRQAPASVGDLILRRSALTGLASRIPEQQAWTAWLRERLPADLAAHVVNVVPKAVSAAGDARELIVMADSPAWCARLRYTLAALEIQIRARDGAVQVTRVRTAPRR
jgi:hypothetical protein